MKICVYVLSKNAKQTYKKECFDIRINAGISIVSDILIRNGYTDINYAGKATVHKYDVVLFSVTADCDWWEFVAERVTWIKGNYIVCVGGQGVLNVRPFLPLVDYFMLGRAEGVVDKLIKGLDECGEYEGEGVVNSRTFSPDKTYMINQVNEIYPYDISLPGGGVYHEDTIGCNHKCLFCGYTWHRKPAAQEAFNYSGLWNGGKDRERAMIDLDNGEEIDLDKLRTTAVDGLSERLRFSVNKRITRTMLRNFLYRLATCSKPHQVKFYNILGLPGETEEDWWEFLEDITIVDQELKKSERQTSILLHSTPFREMPATPLACREMQYRNFRGMIGSTLGAGLKGNIFYQGNAIWAVESMATEGLSTVLQSAIIWRGTEEDTDNIIKVSMSSKFRNSSSAIKQVTLEKYFDTRRLFGEYKADDLPTRYLRTYCKVEKTWQH